MSGRSERINLKNESLPKLSVKDIISNEVLEVALTSENRAKRIK